MSGIKFHATSLYIANEQVAGANDPDNDRDNKKYSNQIAGSNDDDKQILAENYLPQNSISFLKFVNEKFNKYRATPESVHQTCDENVVNNYIISEPEFLRQQKLLGDYINNKTEYRGILIYWGLGTGKTGAAIYIANGMPDRQVVWLLPTKALLGTANEEIKKFGDKQYRRNPDYYKMSPSEQEAEDLRIDILISKRFKIMTYNSSKLINKLYQLDAQNEILDPSGILKLKNIQSEKNPLDNKLLVIDEVHNLLRQIIAEGSKTGSAIFHMIMEAKNLKIVTMSGTPIADDPYNLAALFNMLRGYMHVGKETYTLFPSDYEQFRQYFVNEDVNLIKNEKIFAERISGLVTFYNGIYDEKSEIFPRAVDHIVKCEMSAYQQSGYNEVRKKEVRADLNKQKMKGKLIKTTWKKPGRKSVMSSYRMNSRQRCNFVFPEYIERPKNMHLMSGEKKKLAILNALNDLKPEDLDPKKHLRKYSEKMYQVVTRIEASPGPVVVYSQFVELEGLNLLAKIMFNIGYRPYTSVSDTTEQFNRKFTPKFAYFTGKNNNKHDEIKKLYNDPKNSDGSLVKVLLINVVGIEGLNLKGTRQIHYMDEYWFEDRFRQVRGRGVRRCSHFHLPKEDRLVDVYRYHSVPSNRDHMLMEVGEKETTDEYLYNLAKTRTQLMDSFLEVLKYAAFDCELNYEHNKGVLTKKCMRCYTTPEMEKTRKMYAENIKLHMAPGSDYGCVPTQQRQLKKMIHDGETYYMDTVTKKLYQVHPETKVAIEAGFVNEAGRVILR